MATMVVILEYGRTVHSPTQALANERQPLLLYRPDALAMPQYILDMLDEKVLPELA